MVLMNRLKEYSETLKEYLETIEYYNAKLIPVALIVLAIIIVLELFVHIENPVLETTLQVADGLVIAIFMLDLLFMGMKVKSARFFFHHYWLDILAVFPFGLLFKTIEQAYHGLAIVERAAVGVERATIGQAITHETLEIRKEARFFLRSERLAKGVRIAARGLRFVVKSRVFSLFRKQHQKAHRKLYRRKINQ